MVTIHHPWCCVSRSIWSHSADGTNCPGSYWAVTESNLMAGSLMMMSSVPSRRDPVQFQKQIQPFIFRIIVALYQLLPVFYLSLRLMWSFSQTAFCANGVLEHTWRAVCPFVCVCVCASADLSEGISAQVNSIFVCINVCICFAESLHSCVCCHVVIHTYTCIRTI